MSDLLSRLRSARLTQGFSQEEVAHRLGMDPSNYNRIERGKVTLSIEKLERIAELLEVNLCSLFGCESGDADNLQQQLTQLKGELDIRNTEVMYLKQSLRDKEEIIALLKNSRE